MFKFLGLVLLGGMVATFAAEAQGWRPAQRVENVPYALARERLISEGAKPIRNVGAFGDIGRCGARRQICRLYPEVESCAGTGAAPCKFVWRDPRGELFFVTTVGELDVQVDELWRARRG